MCSATLQFLHAYAQTDRRMGCFPYMLCGDVNKPKKTHTHTDIKEDKKKT